MFPCCERLFRHVTTIPVGAFEIAIDAKLDERLGRISSIGVLTPDCGIVRQFNGPPSPSKFDHYDADRTKNPTGALYVQSDRRFFIADSLFLCCERLFRHVTTIPVGAFGIAIDAKLDERLGRISSIGVLTPDCGIVRQFNGPPSPSKFDHYDADRTKNLAEALRQWILSL
ncbi:MAG: hypothetical protein LBB18_00280 [Puniceicoccales bacterium]|nr:hypothetical protein [Puniceicoccales bacterium]